MKAYSKINLVLKVYKKNKNESKHRIDSFFMLDKKHYDKIKIKSSDHNLISFFDKNKNEIKINNESISKVLVYLNSKFKLNSYYQIRIYKKIPFMSGMGGSATDTATIIRYFCLDNKINLNQLDLKEIALLFGSDIPFFIFNYELARVSGYGEIVQEYEPIDIDYELIFNDTLCDTTEVYKHLDKDNDYQSKVDIDKAFESISSNKYDKSIIYNDLQPYCFSIYPNLLDKFNSIINQSECLILSGSGSTFIKFK